jgi:hypothetical protein
MGGGHLAQQREQRLGAAQVLRAEQRVHRPDATGPVARRVAPTEQALRERAVGHHHAALTLGEGHQVGERAGLGEREGDLVADHRLTEGGVGGPPSLQGVVGDPDRADPPFPQQRPHPGHRHRVRDDGVGLVHLVQRDAVELEAAGAALVPVADDGGERRHREDLAGDDDRAAVTTERLAEDLLAAPEAVDLRGVEEGDAEFPGATHDVPRGPAGVVLAVAPLLRPELPRAQTHSADLAQTVDLEEAHGDQSPPHAGAAA